VNSLLLPPCGAGSMAPRVGFVCAQVRASVTGVPGSMPASLRCATKFGVSRLDACGWLVVGSEHDVTEKPLRGRLDLVQDQACQ